MTDFERQRSVLGRRWRLRPADEKTTALLSRDHDLPDVVARVLAGRGMKADEAAAYLKPTLRDQLPDPSSFVDMDAAIDRLAQAVRQGETIGVFGDYDVDGATASALLNRFITAVGGSVLVHIPDRLAEGYGPNTPSLTSLRQQGAGVCVCVDCGITAHEPLGAARTLGLDVIVVDHHEPGVTLPPACAVVNPKRADDSTPHRDLAAVGVAFLLVVGLNRALRQAGWYAAGSGRTEPDLMALLDLVALGTVCDVMPLTGLNRALVTAGLRTLARRGNLGLATLADVAGVKEPPTTYHLGYILGPRINAGGRVGEAPSGTRLLSTADPAEARRLAEALDGFNADRREIEAHVLLEAIEQVDSASAGAADEPLVMAVGGDWHPGVIGIVASRLRERYGLPACVVAIDGPLAKGSGRSIPGLDLGAAVLAARDAGLLMLGGGHAMAAGFTVDPGRVQALRAFLARHLAEQLGEGALDPCLDLDGVVSVEGASMDLLRALALMEPFGAGNPEPTFVVTDARLLYTDVVGAGHVRCQLGGLGGGRLKAIAFRAADSELGQTLLTGIGGSIHVAGTLRLDRWQGRETPQLVIEDASRPG